MTWLDGVRALLVLISWPSAAAFFGCVVTDSGWAVPLLIVAATAIVSAWLLGLLEQKQMEHWRQGRDNEWARRGQEHGR